MQPLAQSGNFDYLFFMRGLASLYFSVGMALLVSGCGLKYQSHSDGLQSFVGASVESLVGAYGAPRSQTELPNEKVVYSFIETRSKTKQTAQIRTERPFDNSNYDINRQSTNVYQKVTLVCEITATTDNTGTILSINSRGEGCEGRWVSKG